ncbi:ATP-binding cassette domain-containing protein [Microlunatus sp. Y2014]|uniref:ABC transporter ATP-binding protein n=1 Tax=Microlunatus sp. Y2014 TaxID=3418488 RepID=UPI003DA7761D
MTKTYGDHTTAVDDLSLDIPQGRVTVFVGPSGCGKTTTLRMLNRMVEPTSGTINFLGEPLKRLRRTTLRRRLGYVIQSGGLFPHRTVAENIGTVPGLLGWGRAKTRRRVGELLVDVGLDTKLAGRYPAQLSGGQQQRVGVARALAGDPEVLLMDEPFSAVDPVVRNELQDLVLRLQSELAKTVVLITHDVDEAVKLGDQVAIMGVGGRLAQFAAPEEILNDPADDFVSGFVGRDRGWRSLSFHPADGLPVERVRAVRTPSAVPRGGHALVLDGGAHPIGWVTPERPGRTVSLGSTFIPTSDSLRVALDAALASPVGFAVAVEEETGRFTGAVSLESIMRQAAELRRTVSIDFLDAREAEERRRAAEARREAAERARRQEAERARVLAEMADADGTRSRTGKAPLADPPEPTRSTQPAAEPTTEATYEPATGSVPQSAVTPGDGAPVAAAVSAASPDRTPDRTAEPAAEQVADEPPPAAADSEPARVGSGYDEEGFFESIFEAAEERESDAAVERAARDDEFFYDQETDPELGLGPQTPDPKATDPSDESGDRP